MFVFAAVARSGVGAYYMCVGVGRLVVPQFPFLFYLVLKQKLQGLWLGTGQEGI